MVEVRGLERTIIKEGKIRCPLCGEKGGEWHLMGSCSRTTEERKNLKGVLKK